MRDIESSSSNINKLPEMGKSNSNEEESKDSRDDAKSQKRYASIKQEVVSEPSQPEPAPSPASPPIPPQKVQISPRKSPRSGIPKTAFTKIPPSEPILRREPRASEILGLKKFTQILATYESYLINRKLMVELNNLQPSEVFGPQEVKFLVNLPKLKGKQLNKPQGPSSLLPGLNEIVEKNFRKDIKQEVDN